MSKVRLEVPSTVASMYSDKEMQTPLHKKRIEVETNSADLNW